MTGLESLPELLAVAGVRGVVAERLSLYGELLLSANRTTNLTAARDSAALLEHLLDSLTLAPDVQGPLIDLGSGAGLPGIPLAIATGQPVVLVDSARKKVQFLTRALAELGLAGEAVAERAEVLGHNAAYRERFACATARAVASAPTVAELAVPFLAIGGHALLQRGALDARERQAVTDAAPMLGAELIAERPIDGSRRVLILAKRIPTQQRFPRRDGVPAKRPLCYTEARVPV